MYPQFKNQNAHSYMGVCICSLLGNSKTPLFSSSSGTPVNRLAMPVLIDVSVGVASV